MTHVFKVGDKGKTRNNLDYEVTVVLQHPTATGKTIIANIEGESITFHDNGRFNYSDEPKCGIDLIPPQTLVRGWLVILNKLSTGTHITRFHEDSGQEAIDKILKSYAMEGFTIRAVVRVDVEEGEGV